MHICRQICIFYARICTLGANVCTYTVESQQTKNHILYKVNKKIIYCTKSTNKNHILYKVKQKIMSKSTNKKSCTVQSQQTKIMYCTKSTNKKSYTVQSQQTKNHVLYKVNKQKIMYCTKST